MSTISGTITHSITLATTGVYASPLTIAATGSVSNNGIGDAIYGPATNAWTVTNLGRVSATGSYDGVDLRAGGSVTNGDTSHMTALIAGGGSIGNWGTIAGGGGGSYGGAGGDGINGSGGGEISNSGVIAGGGGSSYGGFGSIGGVGGAGINLTGGGSIGNSGTIAGGAGGYSGYRSAGGSGGIAIAMSGGGSIGNSGTIAGGAGGSGGYGPDGGSGGIAIAMSGGGTIVNRGLIAGGNGGRGGFGYVVRPGDGGNGGAGIMLSGVGGIANWGTIAGGNGGPGNGGPNGFIQSGPGAAGAGIILSAIGSIANWGAIVGGQYPGTDAGAAVVLSAGGTVINGSAGDGSALIEGSFGIEALGTAGVSVTNFGTVAGFVGGAGVPIYLDGGSTGGAGGIGISLAGGGRIANSGVIAGGDGGIGGDAFRVVVLDSGKGGGGGNGGAGIVLSAFSIIANSGTIAGGQGGAGGTGSTPGASGAAGPGIILNDGGVVTNGSSAGSAALIEGGAGGVGAAGGTGIGLSGGHGRVGNQGTVSGGAGGVGAYLGGIVDIVDAAGGVGGVGISLSNDGEITNGSSGNTTALTQGGAGGLGGHVASFYEYGGGGGRGGAGVALSGGGRIENWGSIGGGSGGAGRSSLSGGYGGSGGTGVSVTGGVVVSNYGRIAGGAGGTGGNGGYNLSEGFPGSGGGGGAGIVLSAFDSISNLGTIAGGGGGAGGHDSEFPTMPEGRYGAMGAGIVLDGGGFVINGSAGGSTALIEGGIGVQALGTTGASITNSGTIEGTGGTAVTIENGAAGKVIVEPGAVFLGKVLGGGNSEIDFAAAGVAGMSNVSGFATIGLSNGHSHNLSLTDANFAAVSGRVITVNGGNAGDTVDAAALPAADRIIVHAGTGNDQLAGGAGNDIFEFSAASLTAADKVSGGAGSDTLVMTSAGAVAAAGVSGVEIYSLSDGGASSLLLTNANFAGVSGTAITVYGSNGGNTVNTSTVTGSNRVVLIGGFGADSFIGGAGNDIFQFAAANLTAADTVQGRSGSDQLRMTSPGTIAAFGVSGVETYTLANGGANSLTLTDANFDGVSGAAITVDGGNTVNASVLTGSNRVIVVGGAGKDIFTGGAGNDIFHFTVANLAASDTVKGGAGIDQLVMTTAGTVLAGGVSAVETYALTNGGANSLTLVNANFSGVTGRVIRVNGGNAGNMVDASALTGANRVVVVGGAGNDTFKFSAASLQSTDVVRGGLGTDRLVMTSAGAVAAAGVSGVETFQLAGGGANSLTLADANFAGATGTTITVEGGNAGNTLKAGALTSPNRVIVTGGGGNDQLTGGAGNDTFKFSAASLQSTDVVRGGLGTDRLVMTSAGAVAAAGVSGVETYSLANGGANSLTLTDANFDGVSGAAITVDGGNGGNTVNASALTGSNRVIVVGGAGKDIFTGGAGNDIFHFTVANLAASDTVKGGAGSDQLVMTSAGTVLAGGVSAVETYALANGGANSLTLVNANFSGVTGSTITVDGGNAGNMVDASALTGANRVVVVGGAGNDTFKFSAASLQSTDVVRGGLGTDRLVMTSAGAVAAAGVSGVETFQLAGGGANSLTLADANFAGATGTTITVEGGNAGNTLKAGALTSPNRVIVTGGGGNDQLTGGAGNDTFKFSAASLQSTDVVRGGLGTDRLVMTSAGAVAAAGVSGVETYALSDGGASSLLLTNANFAGVSGATIRVDGSNGGNTINASTVTGSNRVILIGGFAADSFTGGAGNDIFQFAAANLTAADTVQGRSGSDQLRMTSPGTIAAFGVSGVETYSLANGGANSLTLTDANCDGVSGAAITVDGGNGGNTVNASALTGSNRVIVVGSTGADTLITAQHAAMTGGGGADLFELTTPGSATVPDTNTIADFTHASDRIAVSNAGFGLGLASASTTPQALPASLFSLQSNGSFTTAAQRFAYNSASGALYFDADGSGAGASRLIASLTHHPTLAAADMTFVS